METRDEAQLSTNHFVDNHHYWLRVYLDFVCYNDPWSGWLYPPTEEGDVWVWDFIVTLPAHLEAVANWSIVILASDVGFQQAHFFNGLEILSHINKLHEAMVKILQSLHPIRPPNKYETSFLIFAMNNANFYQLGVDGVKYYLNAQEIDGQLEYIPGGKWRLSGYRCGVVEKYSGWSRFNAYPAPEITEGASYLTFSDSFWLAGPKVPEGGAFVNVNQPEEYQKFYDRFILLHSLRTWKQARELTYELGIFNIRKAICYLCTMRGIHPLSYLWSGTDTLFRLYENSGLLYLIR